MNRQVNHHYNKTIELLRNRISKIIKNRVPGTFFLSKASQVYSQAFIHLAYVYCESVVLDCIYALTIMINLSFGMLMMDVLFNKIS